MKTTIISGRVRGRETAHFATVKTPTGNATTWGKTRTEAIGKLIEGHAAKLGLAVHTADLEQGGYPQEGGR